MKTRLIPFAFVVPAMLPLIAFGVLPIGVALVVSFTDMNLAGLGDWSQIEFVGSANYSRLFADAAFWQALANTAVFAGLGVPAVIVLSLVIALGLNRGQGRFYRALRSFYFVPAITGIVAVALVWGYLYNTQFGLFNYLLSLAGLPAVPWLSDPGVVKFSVVLVAVWRGLGLNVIIFLAALQGVPKEYLEAAAIDGASELRRTVSIVIPLLRVAIFFVTVTTVIAWLQFFDEPFVLTKGGPLGASTSISLFLYQKGFAASQFGYASAGSVVLFALIAAVTVIQLRVRRTDAD
ncbi:multiple sugar transport system permease protein [Kribbella sp. VKM Ac-2527]|uniref:Multiple sugar transport system permease protein n=1 Tax=Kribbella caucasensis TaxID=2512215 RepID=A0A4R6KK53_9ACTN|nr:sugar ABC transporter permease [Kribbella sp. VKM Ac-2527]TDO51707.1 multiple sugar transport system permease protein [Kribbella sp. VKM Ac-2527]